MRTITAASAQKRLEQLMGQVAASHQPVRIRSERTSTVLVAEVDWRALQEQLALLSIPDMLASLIAGRETPLEDCSTDPGWPS